MVPQQRAWSAPTVSWHAATHQCCNKSIFILTPAPSTCYPPPATFSSSLLHSHVAPSPRMLLHLPQWFSALNRGRGRGRGRPKSLGPRSSSFYHSLDSCGLWVDVFATMKCQLDLKLIFVHALSESDS